MKALYFASGLFLGVLIFLTVNFFMIHSLLNHTSEEFDKIPDKLEYFEEADEKELLKNKKILDGIKNLWEEKENYVCMSLSHETSREFMEKLVSAISFFESQEYAEFLADKESARDSLDHMKFDEGFKLGNFF